MNRSCYLSQLESKHHLGTQGTWSNCHMVHVIIPVKSTSTGPGRALIMQGDQPHSVAVTVHPGRERFSWCTLQSLMALACSTS